MPDLITFVIFMKIWFGFSLILLLFSQCSEYNSKSTQQEQLRESKKNSAPFIKNKPDSNSFKFSSKTDVKNVLKPVHKNRNKKEQQPFLISPVSNNRERADDSFFIQKMLWLRSENIEIDLQEPKSREFLYSPFEDIKFSSMKDHA